MTRQGDRGEVHDRDAETQPRTPNDAAMSKQRFGPTWPRLRAAVGARVHEHRVRPADIAGVRVLTYHGLVDAKTDAYLERNFHTIRQFREHLRILRRHRVVPPEQVIDAAKEASQLTVAITFDDGYRNNEIAAELLDAARLPWALYVSTGEVGGDSTIWTVRLGLLLLHGKAPSVEAFDQKWDLTDRNVRLASFGAVRRRAKQLGRPDRVALLDELVSQFEPGEEERLLTEFPSFNMLNWSDLRSLRDGGAAIGSHGVDHEIHHERQPDHVIEDELHLSQRAISENLGAPCTSLAYPNGDFTDRSRRVAQELGYLTAFSTVDDTVHAGTDPLALPRLTARGDLTGFHRSLLTGQSGNQ